MFVYKCFAKEGKIVYTENDLRARICMNSADRSILSERNPVRRKNLWRKTRKKDHG